MKVKLSFMFTSQLPAIFLTVMGGVTSIWGSAAASDSGIPVNPFTPESLQVGGFVGIMSALVWAFMNNKVLTAKALTDYKEVVDRSAEKERAHCDAQIADLKEQISDLRTGRDGMIALIQPFVSGPKAGDDA